MSFNNSVNYKDASEANYDDVSQIFPTNIFLVTHHLFN